MVRRIAGFLIAGLLLAGCKSGALPPAAENAGAAPATQAQSAQVFPDFKVKNFDGQEVSLAQYRGKILILDLFATWCPPCRKEIPHFVELQQTHKEILNVVGLSYDQSAAQDVLAFARDMKINYDIFWGSEEIAQYVGLRGIPHTLVIDPQGHVAKSYVGYRDKAVFEKDVLDLAAQPKP
jgi:cytochrome c biogenesis protein CcmG/thiol:disulfide interchange protein DsbE